MFLKLLPWIFGGFMLAGIFAIIFYYAIVEPWLDRREKVNEDNAKREFELEKLRIQRDIAYLGESTATTINETLKEKEGSK
jgi:hypothetical protein